MNLNFKKQQIYRVALFIIAGHTALLIIQLPQTYILGLQKDQGGFEWIALARLVWGSLVSTSLTPFILLAGYYWPIDRRHLLRNLVMHFLLSIVMGLVQHFVYNFGAVSLNLRTVEDFSASVLNLRNIAPFVSSAMVRYAVIVAIQQAYVYSQESQKRAALLRDAELEMLKMQLHPHFFFNTLNAISALINQSPKEAKRLIAQLGDLFRITLRKDKAQEITLKEELEFLQAFFQIHQTLMGKRLQIKWQIKPETLDAQVPNLILQPLAENAIQHGIAPLEAGGQISISAERQNGNLLLQVSNDSEGFVFRNNGENSGIGLSNTRARLENLYHETHKFSVEERANGTEVVVKMEIPFREQLEKNNEY